MNNAFTIMPSFSIDPVKCCSFARVFKRSDFVENWDQEPKAKVKRKNHFLDASTTNEVVRSSHNLKLSDNAYRTLKRKINWLFYLAKARHVKTYNSKDIYNFKVAFITLTLSSKQAHSTKEVTNLLFNTFLTEIRQRTNMANYVWRLEFQENGNVHYHLVTDTYLDYFFLKKIWNRIQKNHGYIDDYKKKHEALSLSQYCELYKHRKNATFQSLAKSYAEGKKNNWEQPPSVDVISAHSKTTIAHYLSKYFAKTDEGKPLCNTLDTAENSANLRIWFCSRSLSKLNSVTNFVEAVNFNIFEIIKTAKKLFTHFGRYCTVYYYDIKNLSGHSRKFVEMLLKDYATKNGYIPTQ